MNVNIFQKANQRQVKMSGTSLLCKHLIDHLEVDEWLDLVLVLMEMVML